MRGLVLAVCLGALCAATSAPALAQSGAVQVDARAEVAAALFAASATQAAAERAADARLRAQAVEIERLRREGRASRAQIAELEERYVADLAQRDRAYAQEIAVFRTAVQDIASTPEGAAALARFNAGDEIGAMAVLDQLVDARERARRVRANVETAAERRRVGTLALDARARGRLETEAVIARYEEITRLDPGEFYDWDELGALYLEAGRLSDAVTAAERAEQTALTSWQRGGVFELRTDAAMRAGDLEAAARFANEGLLLSRQIIATGEARSERGDGPSGDRGYGDTLNSEDAALLNLSIDLDRVAGIARLQGDLERALSVFEESRAIRAALSARNTALYLVETHAGVLANLGNVYADLGDHSAAIARYEEAIRLMGPLLARTEAVRVRANLAHVLASIGDAMFALQRYAEANESYEESLAIAQRLAAADPGSARLQIAVSAGLDRVGDVLVARDDLAAARARFEQSLAIRQRLAAVDPSSGSAQRDVYVSLLKVGDVLVAQGDLTGARARYEESLAIAQRLAAQDPSSASRQRDVCVSMWRLQRFPESGITWARIVSTMEDMERRGVLLPADRQWLEQARANATRERGQ